MEDDDVSKINLSSIVIAAVVKKASKATSSCHLMKLDTFSINIQHYSQNHKIAFLGHPMGESEAIQALYVKDLM